MNSLFSVLAMIGAVYMRARNEESFAVDMVCTTIFVVAFDYIDINLLEKNAVSDKIFSTIGKYSFQLWLLSGMFFLNTTEFTWLLYKPGLSFLILVWNIVMLLPLAVLTQKLAMLIFKVITEKTARHV